MRKKRERKASLPVEMCIKLTIKLFTDVNRKKVIRFAIQLLYSCHGSHWFLIFGIKISSIPMQNTLYPLIRSTCRKKHKSSVLLGFLKSDRSLLPRSLMLVIPTSGIAKCRTQSKQWAAFAWCQLSFLQTKLKQLELHIKGKIGRVHV